MAVKKNIVANYAGQAITALLGLAFVPVYISFLSIEAYGLLGLFAVVQVWFALLDLGLAPTLSRELARFTAGSVSLQRIRDLVRSVEIICLGISVGIAIVIFAVADFAAEQWLQASAVPVSTIADSFRIMAIVVGLRFFEGIYRSALIGLQAQVWLNVATASIAAMRAFGALAVLALVSATIEAFFLWQLIISSLALLLFGMKVHRLLPPAPRRPRFSLTALRDVRTFAGGMIGIAILAVMLTQIDKLLLSRLLPLNQFGYYMLAATITGTIYIVVSPITQAVYPEFVQMVQIDDRQRLVDSYHSAAQLVTVMLTPAVALLIFYPKALLFAWTNDPSLATIVGPTVALLAIGTFCNGLMHIPHQMQLAFGWTGLALKSNLLASAILVPALLVVVPHNGPVAAAAIWAVLNMGYVVLQTPLMHRRILIGEQRAWYWRDVVRPIFACLMIVVPATLLWPDNVENRLISLVALPAIGTAMLVSAALAARSTRERLIAMVQSQLPNGDERERT